MANASSIRRKISNYRKKIDAYERDIDDLYEAIARIEEISSYLSQRLQKFIETQTQHMAVVSRINELTINQNITLEFSGGMSRDLTGDYYQSGHDGLTNAIRAAENRIEELRQEIQKKQWQISDWQDTIVYLQHKLYDLEND